MGFLGKKSQDSVLPVPRCFLGKWKRALLGLIAAGRCCVGGGRLWSLTAAFVCPGTRCCEFTSLAAAVYYFLWVIPADTGWPRVPLWGQNPRAPLPPPFIWSASLLLVSAPGPCDSAWSLCGGQPLWTPDREGDVLSWAVYPQKRLFSKAHPAEIRFACSWISEPCSSTASAWDRMPEALSHMQGLPGKDALRYLSEDEPQIRTEHSLHFHFSRIHIICPFPAISA